MEDGVHLHPVKTVFSFSWLPHLPRIPAEADEIYAKRKKGSRVGGREEVRERWVACPKMPTGRNRDPEARNWME